LLGRESSDWVGVLTDSKIAFNDLPCSLRQSDAPNLDCRKSLFSVYALGAKLRSVNSLKHLKQRRLQKSSLFSRLPFGMPVNAILLAAGALCAAVRSFPISIYVCALAARFFAIFGIRFFTLQS